MGLLDDAIREHLDLKRSRGGDPAEIEKAEREALGPVRREPVSVAEMPDMLPPGRDGSEDADWVKPVEKKPAKRRSFLGRRSAPAEPAEAEDEQPPTLLEGAAPIYDDPPSSEPAFAEDHFEDEFAIEPTAEAPPADPTEPPAAPTPFRSPSATTSPPPASGTPDEPHPDAASAPDPSTPPSDEMLGETIEYDVEGAFQEGTKAEDVLEETPEFLQDTPDHDRLWFEQRPPRDFDFEG